MWKTIQRVFDRLDPIADTRALRDVVVVRPAQDADIAPLHDLAELDSAAPLTGPVLLAVVDGRPWAALALDDGRVVADPFRPAAGAVELLRLRGAQLRAGAGARPPASAGLPLRVRRARA
jgi:hypothetical protein